MLDPMAHVTVLRCMGKSGRPMSDPVCQSTEKKAKALLALPNLMMLGLT